MSVCRRASSLGRYSRSEYSGRTVSTITSSQQAVDSQLKINKLTCHWFWSSTHDFDIFHRLWCPFRRKGQERDQASGYRKESFQRFLWKKISLSVILVLSKRVADWEAGSWLRRQIINSHLFVSSSRAELPGSLFRRSAAGAPSKCRLKVWFRKLPRSSVGKSFLSSWNSLGRSSFFVEREPTYARCVGRLSCGGKGDSSGN